MSKKLILLIVIVMSLAGSVVAQYNNNFWAQANMNLMNNVTTAQLIARNCADVKAAGRSLPDSTCCQFKRHGNKVGLWTRLDGSCGDAVGDTVGVNKTQTRSSATSKFTPVSGDNSLELFADSVGTTRDEKKLMLQLAANTKSAFEQEYGTKGWKNNLAGAYTFFVLATGMVYNEKEPSKASLDAFFRDVDQTIGSDAAMSSASNKEKTALYNSLIAYGGLPLMFYVNGKQTGNEAEVAKAKQLAAAFIRMVMKTEPESLKGLFEQ